MMVVYEIHTFRDAAWKIDSVFDDRDLAVLEALRVERSHRHAAVRVVEESIDEATDRTVTRTIYRTGKVNRAGGDLAAQDQLSADGPGPSSPGGSMLSLPRMAEGSPLVLLATLALVAVACSGLGALYALNLLNP